VTGLATAREVADYLRTTSNQLNRLRYEGHGPRYVKLGRSVRYRWDDVHAWVEDNLRTASAGSGG
jgi:excisionase family DNA binding protein